MFMQTSSGLYNLELCCTYLKEEGSYVTIENIFKVIQIS